MNDTVTIAVIGNTSSGKTSFLRSLMRDLSFGEVGVDVTTNSKKNTGENNVNFVDTPGFQGSELIREWVEEEIEKLERPSPEKIVNIILKHQDRTDLQLQEGIMKHDKIAWQALKDVDAILYLVDIRQSPNLEGNVEASYTLLPDNQVQIIFNFLPSDKSKLESCRKAWDALKNKWGNKGTFIDYDAFHRDYEAEMNVLRGIRSKLIDSSKVDLMDRYIQKRADEEKNRLLLSFKAVIYLINHLANLRYKAEKIPKSATSQDNVHVIYGMLKERLREGVKNKLIAFYKTILYIWGFRTYEKADSFDRNNSDLLQEIRKYDPSMFAMSKLVLINTSEIYNVFSKWTVFVSWDNYFSNIFPWVTDKRIDGYVYLSKSLVESFIPCALDFIKKVRERGIATPSSLYPLTQDKPCQKVNSIKFIMPTEPEVSQINAAFKNFKWKSQKAAIEEWIPEFFKLFGMPKKP